MGLLAFGFVGVAGWGAFIKYTTNQERLASSVVRQILQNLRESDLVRETLGEGVRPEPTWYLNGDPWIDGTVSQCFVLCYGLILGGLSYSDRSTCCRETSTLPFE